MFTNFIDAKVIKKTKKRVLMFINFNENIQIIS